MGSAMLKVAGRKLDTWTRVSVSVSMVEMTPTFEFEFVDANPIQPLPIGKNYPCQVYLGGHLAITGYMDRVSTSSQRESGTSTYRVQGRGKTADLVDCSARHRSGRFKDAGFLTIANALCKPYGIPVVIGDGMDALSLARLTTQITTKFKRFKLRVGDTVHGVLSKVAKERGCVLMESPKGELILTRSGSLQLQTGLDYATNVESWQREDDATSQYSEYEILGQRWGSNTWNGDDARGARGTAEDDSAWRFRPLTMMADRSVSSGDLEARAKYERNLRRGLSRQVRVTVPGWTYTEPSATTDTLWRPNRIVRARNDEQDINDKFIIVDCTYTKDRSGSRTTMSLAPPETFEPFEPPKKPKKKRRGLPGWQRLILFENAKAVAYVNVLLGLKANGESKV